MVWLFLLVAVSVRAADAPAPSGANAKAAPPRPARPRMGTAALRNENVPVYQIDNNAIKEANIRLGNRATAVTNPAIESGYFAAEHGQPASEAQALGVNNPRPGWHGEASWFHQNSVFNARTFFQVGSVLPSRRNQFGARGTGSLGRLGFLTALFGQRQVRGMVNGNVLVPLAHERVPKALDPAARAIVTRFLRAFPDQLPNRPDFDERALNTNAPQSIRETEGTVRLDRSLGKDSSVSATWALLRQSTDAFQFVAGQNPDMDIRSHRARLTWRKALSAATELAVSSGFQRTRSLLAPEPNAVGPRVRFGFQVQELGPDSEFPIDRVQNRFRYGADLRRTAGAHVWTLGGSLARFQLNGIETNNQRGYFQFTNNFGRTAIENFLLGTPSSFEASIGELYRAFRNWSSDIYVADRWQIHSRLLITWGLRYNLETAPVERRGLDVIPYGCDCNNFAPRLALAWRTGRGWVMRAAGIVSFSAIQPVTYQQIRNNLPNVRYVQLQDPDLVEPLRDLGRASRRNSPTVLSPDMVSPYSYQYNVGFEKSLASGHVLRLGYLGSRTFKLLNSYVQNRAVPVADPGRMTTATVDSRRPDPSQYEIKYVLNGGIGYYDAAQVSWETSLARGFTGGIGYTWSKAIDEGPDFSSTAANGDMLRARSQSQYESLRDRRGLSNFDSPHALSMYWSYDLPAPSTTSPWTGFLLRGWQVSGAAVLKKGTPVTLYIGSDAPGFGNVDGSPSDRPHILDPSILGSTLSHPDRAPQILRRDRFAFIGLGELRGSLGKNTFRRARLGNVNSALSKQWRLGGRREWTAIFRAEAYNLTNTPQFDEPQRNLSSPSFGRITNTLNDGRVLQLGLRFVL